MIIGHTELDGAVGTYNLYRQRSVNGVATGEPVLLAKDLEAASYEDENIVPGGEYCYWVTMTSKGVESCIDDTSCVFILYKQTINRTTTISKTYGDPDFTIDYDGTADGYHVRSNADTVDYFVSRNIPLPITLSKYDGDVNAITLTPTIPPSSPTEPDDPYTDYTVSIDGATSNAGYMRLVAEQMGIPDTLLAATPVAVVIYIDKLEMLVKATDKSRHVGEPNPAFELVYQSFAYTDDVNSLLRPPEVHSYATPASPAGDYAIVVTVYDDPNYTLIPVNGVLKVSKTDEGINTFTPYDNDGINDEFMPGNRMKIYNRYGVLVFESKTAEDKDHGWSGRFQNNNRFVDPGVYYYVIVDDNGKVTRTGSVNVVKK
jgi:hypothetical protein